MPQSCVVLVALLAFSVAAIDDASGRGTGLRRTVVLVFEEGKWGVKWIRDAAGNAWARHPETKSVQEGRHGSGTMAVTLMRRVQLSVFDAELSHVLTIRDPRRDHTASCSEAPSAIWVPLVVNASFNVLSIEERILEIPNEPHQPPSTRAPTSISSASNCTDTTDVSKNAEERRTPWIDEWVGTEMRRSAELLAESTIEHRAIQIAGYVDEHPNFVFMSAGYVAGQEQIFFDDVDLALTAMLEVEPWDKYLIICNIWAVFQASEEEGASKPSQGLVKENNLGCSYGRTIVRSLNCDYYSVVALAATAPAADLRIVLVNDALYGGTGGGGNAVLYNGEKMPPVLMHEIGHALGRLSDEYDYGYTERTDIALVNCWGGTQGEPPWQKWINIQAVPRTPSAVCGYTNYYKPTTGTCTMESSEHGGYCPVCREALVRSLFLEPSAGLNMASPRCPVEGEVAYITREETMQFAVNPRWAQAWDDVTITWDIYLQSSHAGVISLDSIAHTHLDAANAGTFTFTPSSSTPLNNATHPAYTIVASFVDATPWILPNLGMNHTAVFELVLLPQDASKAGLCTPATCHASFLTGSPSYCSNCTSGRNCSLDVHWKAYEPDDDFTTPFKKRWAELGLVGTCIVVGSVFLACGVWAIIKGLLVNREGVHINRYTKPMRWMSRYVFVLSVVYMVLGLLAVLYGVYIFQFGDDEVVGETFVIVTSVVLVGYFLHRILCLTGISCKSRVLLAVSCLLLLAEVAFYLYAFVFVLSYAENMGGRRRAASDALRSIWTDHTANNPTLVCSTQRSWECSGWLRSCHNTPNPYECPPACEKTNLNVESCSSVVERWFATYSVFLSVILALSSVLWLSAFSACLALACTIVPISHTDTSPLSKASPSKQVFFDNSDLRTVRVKPADPSRPRNFM